MGFPAVSDRKESACNVGNPLSIPWSGRAPGERERLPTPVFWPGKFHGQSSLSGLQSMGLQKVRHDWVTNTLTFRVITTFLSGLYTVKLNFTENTVFPRKCFRVFLDFTKYGAKNKIGKSWKIKYFSECLSIYSEKNSQFNLDDVMKYFRRENQNYVPLIFLLRFYKELPFQNSTSVII